MLTEAEGGEGTAAGPCTYRLAVQALQVDDEGLVVILAPGDLGERRGSLAQQVVLRELADRNGTIVRPTPLDETIAPHLSAQGQQEALHGIPREPSLHFFMAFTPLAQRRGEAQAPGRARYVRCGRLSGAQRPPTGACWRQLAGRVRFSGRELAPSSMHLCGTAR